MKGIKNIISIGILAAGLVGLLGCDKKDNKGSVTDIQSTGYNSSIVAIGDLDNDGLADLAVSDYKGVYVLKNKGNFKFENTPK